MEYKFITLLKDHNDWMDWIENRYTESEGVEEPEHFPCYVIDECVGFEDVEEGDNKGAALFAPHFLYRDEVEEMLENLE